MIRKGVITKTYKILAMLGLSTLALSAPAHAVSYWNLFNLEEESTQSAQYVMYNSLTDMLMDTNRVGLPVAPNGNLAARNVVGSGATLLAGPGPGPGPGPIPEPSTMLLFGTGLAGLAAWQLKKGKQT